MAGAPATSRPERCRPWSQQTHDTKLSWQVRKPNTPFFIIFIWRKERSGFTHWRRALLCVYYSVLFPLWKPFPLRILATLAQSLLIFNTGIEPESYLSAFFSDIKIFPSFHVFQTGNKEHEEPPVWCYYGVVGKSEAFSTLSIIGLLDKSKYFSAKLFIPEP